MDSRLEFRRNPIVLIMLAVVGAMQGLLAVQNLMYGRLTFALLHLFVAVFALGITAWLFTVPLLRVEGEKVTVFKNAFRPQSLDRGQISAVDVEGKRTFLVLVDGSRVEVPLAMASARDRDQMLAALQGLAGS